MQRSTLNTAFTILALVFVVLAAVATLNLLGQLPSQTATPTADGSQANQTPTIANTPAFAAAVEASVKQSPPSEGQILFGQYGCMRCHGTPSGPGPYFIGMAERAATRRPGYSATAYLYESIVEPNAFVPLPFPGGLMPLNLKDQIPPDEIDKIVAYLLTK
jgi:mono/diheme cytochrome c family protein